MKKFQLILQLSKLNVPIVEVTPRTVLEDATIVLGGQYDGIHLSVGRGYYSVVREMEDETFLFIDGRGNLQFELIEALQSGCIS